MPPSSPSIKTKKSLGQHWLKSPGAVAAIVAAGEIKPGEMVLEIGPGRGVLTEALLAAGARVTAVEKDERLIKHLNLKFKVQKSELTLIRADILDFIKANKLAKLGSYKLIANIPYYLTNHLIKLLLTQKNQPGRMVLLIQKEVAERIAKNKKSSLLSISVQAYGQPKYIKTIKRGAFQPPPKVDSAILLIDKISKKNFQTVNEEKFFAILRQGFAHPRKFVRRNLNIGEGEWQKFGLGLKSRPENLKLADWLKISTAAGK